MSRVVIVGGGIAGATAALELATAGESVVLLERSERLGGLVVSFEVGGTPLECFYHHVFPHEQHIRSLIGDLGLADRLDWLPSTMGVLTNGRLWPFTTPGDILRFGPLTIPQRLHLGVGGLRLQTYRDWQRLDRLPAREWLRRTTGAAAVRELWDPLLRAKFGPAATDVPAAWMWGRFAQRRGARRGSGETLGYLRGGFRQLFDALTDRLTSLGVDIQTGSRVERVADDGERVTGVVTDSGSIDGDTVIYTGALPGIAPLVDQRWVDARWTTAEGLGVLCAVVETDRPISDTYWTNICDERLTFGGLIEHTNLVPASDYNGRHVTYLGRYFTTDEDIATADPQGQAELWLKELAHVVPTFDPSSVLNLRAFRTPYAAPLVTLGYLDKIPPMRASLPGLYVCTTAQIYPQDRGMSEGVRMGATVAREVLGSTA